MVLGSKFGEVTNQYQATSIGAIGYHDFMDIMGFMGIMGPSLVSRISWVSWVNYSCNHCGNFKQIYKKYHTSLKPALEVHPKGLVCLSEDGHELHHEIFLYLMWK